MAKIGIRLAASDKEDGLTSDIRHGERSTDFIVLHPGSVLTMCVSPPQDAMQGAYDGVEFGQDDTVNPSLALCTANPRTREILERAIELRQLVHCLVADQCFADKDDLVWVVHRHELERKVSTPTLRVFGHEWASIWLDDVLDAVEEEHD